MSLLTLQPSQTALLLIDVQEKLFASIENASEILKQMNQLVKSFQILQLPILQSEQYPQGLGQTISSLRTILGETYHPWIKSSFSCLDDSNFSHYISSLPYRQWVLIGIEAHICVLQTVKGFIQADKQVTIAADAIGSRSMSNCATALAEMREMGARISCTETILFELLKDSKHPQFKAISELIKNLS